MKFLIVLLGVALFIANGQTQASKKCHDVKTDHYWEADTDYHPIGRCTKLKCLPNGAILGTGCGIIGAPPGCELTPYDLSKPLPECCPQIKC